MGAIRKIGKKWYVDYYYDGRRIRQVAGSRKDAELALKTAEVDAFRGKLLFKRERKITFESFAEKEYLEHAKVHKKSWERSDKVYLNRLTSFFKGKILCKITPKLIEDYKRLRIDEYKQRNKKEKVKPATVNRELACLKHMLKLAKKWGYIDENPAKDVDFFDEQKKKKLRILSRDEIERLLAESSEHLREIIIIALGTGMRRGELFKLKWDDCDFEKSIISLWDTKSYPRKIPMSTLVADTLEQIDRVPELEYVFCNLETGKPFTTVKTGFNGACRRAGIKIKFHDLRHTAASLMLREGASLISVSRILGHKNLETTAKYLHSNSEDDRQAVEVLAAVFGGGSVEEETQVSDMRDLPYSRTHN